MIHFYWPWLALLLPLPIIFRCFPASKIEEQQECPEINFPAILRLKSAFKGTQILSFKSNFMFLTLLGLSWIFLILALMQPEKVDQLKQVKNHGYDLMLAVDISGSMQAVDFSTPSKVVSRLDATKDVVGKFVLGRQGDRVGLITFGENAYLHVPLTLDTVSVSQLLNDVIAGMAGNATAIGDAIGLGVRTLRSRPKGSRVLVLLTDGEDNSSSIPPLEAAKLAKQYGIRIYTVAVGKNGQVPFPNGYGGYALANVSIDEKLLKEIADMTGGQFFQAADKRVLESIYEKINQLERTEAENIVTLIREPLYYYPLSISLLIIFFLTVYQLFNRRRVLGV